MVDLNAPLTSFQGRTRTVKEWMDEMKIDDISARFGYWVVTSHGLENLVTPYDIPALQLGKRGTIGGMSAHRGEEIFGALGNIRELA